MLITLDTLRADSVRGEQAEMPAVEALAERGLVFERAYSSTSSTQPTHASLFTGLHPWQHGVTRNGMVLGEEQHTLAERLRDSGFETSAIVASFPLHRTFGYDQGFDRFDDSFVRSLQNRDEWRGQEVEGKAFYVLAKSVTDRAIADIDRASAPKQFFWFHYFDAHAPYGDTRGKAPKRKLKGAAGEGPDYAASRKLYDLDVRSLDKSLARLFDRLQRDADSIETHIVVTSDHGESFGEDGSFGHETRVTGEQVHVPLIIASPRVKSSIRDDPTGSVDVYSTLLSLAGARPDGSSRGIDLTSSSGVDSAVGMRRTFDLEEDSEADTDREPRFYCLRGDKLYAGNSDRVFENVSPYDEVTGELGEELRELFRGYQSELERNAGQSSDDPDAREGLSALGYTE